MLHRGMRIADPPTETAHSHHPPLRVLDLDSSAPRPILYLDSVFVPDVRGFDHLPMLMREVTGILGK